VLVVDFPFSEIPITKKTSIIRTTIKITARKISITLSLSINTRRITSIKELLECRRYVNRKVKTLFFCFCFKWLNTLN